MATKNEVEVDFDDAEGYEANEDLEVVVDTSIQSDDAEASEAEGAEVEAAVEPTDDADAPEVAPAPADDEDAELEALPAKVKKRFQREKRLRDTIIQEREQIRGVAIQVAQLAKEREDEIVALKKHNATLQKQFADTLDYTYDRDIHIVAGDIRKAKEEGNYDTELKLQGELDKLRFQQNQLRQMKATLPEPDSVVATPQTAPKSASAPQAQVPQQQTQSKPPPLAVKWIETNKGWFLNPKFKAHHNFVRTIDEAIVAEGYDPQSAEYYKELDRRIDQAFPALRKKPQAVTSPVGAVGSRPAVNRSKRTIVLTREDLANMARYKLDPNNEVHRREYALSKRAHSAA